MTVTLWASAFVGIRSAGQDLSPGALALGRLLVSTAVLSLAAAVVREPLPPRGSFLRIAAYGVLWLGVYSVVLNEAERRVDAGTAAMLVNTGPILIALLAGIVLREGFPAGVVAGCVVAFAGSALIGFATSERSVSAGWGAGLCLVAALAYAVAVVAQKPVLQRVSAFQVTWFGCLIATVACLPFLPRLMSELGDASGSAIGWAVYLGIFPTALGFITWAYALKRTTAGRSGSATYLVPAIAILLGWAVLAESPPWLAVAGGALCLGGVVLARR